MKGYFFLLIVFLLGLFLYQKYISKKVDGTEEIPGFGYSKDPKRDIAA